VASARVARVRRSLISLAAAGISLLAVGCGSDEDFENEPRASAAVELTAKVDDKEVVVSPSEVGAGLVVVTVSNLSRDPIQLTFDGPSTANAPAKEVPSSTEVAPSGVGHHKVDLEQGDYTIGAGDQSDARPDRLEVGPERASSTNEVLLP
jgi:hypothetical protein